MNELKIINEQKVLGKDFTVYGSFENPLFLAKDVASWIEHSDVSMMLKKVDEDEKVTNIVCTPGGNQTSWFLTENGLYEVLMQSRKPKAKEFKKEVKKILHDLRTNKTVLVDVEDTTLKQAFLMMTKAFNTLSETQRVQADIQIAQDKRLSKLEEHFEERKALLPPSPLSAREHIKQLVNTYSRKKNVEYSKIYSWLYSEYDLRKHTSVKKAAKIGVSVR